MYEYMLLVFLILYVFFDFNYILRTLFTVLSGRIWDKPVSLKHTTTIYGICTFLDCDVKFKSLRLGRLLRELDMARFHYYDRTGIFHRSCSLNISSLQGSTLTFMHEPVGLFQMYKINTKLVYWDARSFFFEHEVVTLSDNKLCFTLVSRQFAVWKHGDSTEALLKGLVGSETTPSCPEYIRSWVRSMEISSKNLRKNIPDNRCTSVDASIPTC